MPSVSRQVRRPENNEGFQCQAKRWASLASAARSLPLVLFTIFYRPTIDIHRTIGVSVESSDIPSDWCDQRNRNLSVKLYGNWKTIFSHWLGSRAPVRSSNTWPYSTIRGPWPIMCIRKGGPVPFKSTDKGSLALPGATVQLHRRAWADQPRSLFKLRSVNRPVVDSRSRPLIDQSTPNSASRRFRSDRGKEIERLCRAKQNGSNMQLTFSNPQHERRSLTPRAKLFPFPITVVSVISDGKLGWYRY